MFELEEQIRQANYTRIAGVDEAGRGPIAGPVVAGAVIFPHGVAIPGIADSKLLTPTQRVDLLAEIQDRALALSFSIVESGIIDRINILQASLLAMKEALHRLHVPPDYVLVDGNRTPETPWPCQAVVRGDRFCFSIAAASIVAKVTRDRIMEGYHRQYPAYGFDQHKGYPTRHHIEMVRRHGLSPIHRRSFRIRALESGDGETVSNLYAPEGGKPGAPFAE
jgi:ribonuclease HII